MSQAKSNICKAKEENQIQAKMNDSENRAAEAMPAPIEEHASKLKEDINGFDSFSAYNRHPMPAKTYRILINSLTALCDKILRQPTPTQLYESVENVRILLPLMFHLSGLNKNGSGKMSSFS
jgi:hypothetical protein